MWTLLTKRRLSACHVSESARCPTHGLLHHLTSDRGPRSSKNRWPFPTTVRWMTCGFAWSVRR